MKNAPRLAGLTGQSIMTGKIMTDRRNKVYSVSIIPRYAGGFYIEQMSPDEKDGSYVEVDTDQVPSLVEQLIENYEFRTGKPFLFKEEV